MIRQIREHKAGGGKGAYNFEKTEISAGDFK